LIKPVCWLTAALVIVVTLRSAAVELCWTSVVFLGHTSDIHHVFFFGLLPRRRGDCCAGGRHLGQVGARSFVIVPFVSDAWRFVALPTIICRPTASLRGCLWLDVGGYLGWACWDGRFVTACRRRLALWATGVSCVRPGGCLLPSL